MPFLLKIERPSSGATANVKNPRFHISCCLPFSGSPVLVLGQIVLWQSLTRIYEAVIPLYCLNYMAALEEIVQLMTVCVLTILQQITILPTTDKKKSQGFTTIYPWMGQAWQLAIETEAIWTHDLHYENL